VGPYRQPGEDNEALVLEREIAEFRACAVKHARRVRVAVLVAVTASLGLFCLLCTLILAEGAPRRVSYAPQRCETHMIRPENGAPVPIAVCW
jgi:hypothetical protein